jgi:ATP-dependent phosphofructokinase / diphosphate-dependent phosphofructokinase
MTSGAQRIAINCGGGYVPGLNAVVTGAVLAAHKLGWEILCCPRAGCGVR